MTNVIKQVERLEEQVCSGKGAAGCSLIKGAAAIR